MTYREALEDNMQRFYLISGKKRKGKTRYDTSKISPPSADSASSGSVLHISLPAGTEVELLNIIELISPSGVSLEARLPFIEGGGFSKLVSSELSKIINSIQEAGGTVEMY
ncbi:MAG: hypothetical protein N3I35_12745 [Clostridia bacterium]|nr:hypothetical protein [Clostridia bacterium]